MSLARRTLGVRKFDNLVTWNELNDNDKQDISDLLSFFISAFYSQSKKSTTLEERCNKYEELLKKIKQYLGNKKFRQKT
mgnify:CR=1 FL=1